VLREMIPPQALLILLLTLSIINVVHVDAQNEYIIEKSFYTKYSVCHAGVEAVINVSYGNATILIDIPNPPIYSYRNVHLVLLDHKCFYELSQHKMRSPIPQEIFKEKSENVKERFSEINITTDVIVRNVVLTLSPGPINASVEWRYIFIIDLSKAPIDLIIKIIGEEFKDMKATIIVYDKRLIEIRDLYDRYGILKIGEEIRNIVSSEEAQVLLKNIITELGDYFGFAGLEGASSSPVDRGWPTLADISVTSSYSDVSEIIKRFVREIADIARRKISEQIPLYIYFSEYGPRVVAIPELELVTTQNNTNTMIPRQLNQTHVSPDVYPEAHKIFRMIYIGSVAGGLSLLMAIVFHRILIRNRYNR